MLVYDHHPQCARVFRNLFRTLVLFCPLLRELLVSGRAGGPFPKAVSISITSSTGGSVLGTSHCTDSISVTKPQLKDNQTPNKENQVYGTMVANMIVVVVVVVVVVSLCFLKKHLTVQLLIQRSIPIYLYSTSNKILSITFS